MDNSISLSREESLELRSPPNFVTTRTRIDKEIANKSDFKQFEEKVLTLLTKQDEKMTSILNEFSDLKASVEFMNANYESLRKEVASAQNSVKAVEAKLQTYEANDKLIVDLQAKIDTMEQRARQCNIEIGNLPEKRGEQLCGILETIGDLIKHPIPASDIIAIHRVPHADPKSKHPKNVVVKMSSEAARDNVLAAYRLAKGVTAEAIGITGQSKKTPIYMNEHLTLRNKGIFREARKVAKEYQFKYVWSKHGTVLVRHSDSAPAIPLRSIEDVVKIKNYKPVSVVHTVQAVP